MAEANNGNMTRKRFTSSLWLRITLIILAVLLLFFIGLYICYFNGGISTEHRQWSEFGDYIAGVAGILNFIAFVVLTVSLHKIEREREDNSKKIESEREERSIRLHAEELVVNKLQSQLEVYYRQYIAYQQYQSKFVARRTFDFLQPLMTYLYYLKSISFLPQPTKDKISEIHEYLFDASDTLYTYAYDIYEKGQLQKIMTAVLKIYSDIYRRLEELEVMMIADIAAVSDEEVVTNYREEKEAKDIK